MNEPPYPLPSSDSTRMYFDEYFHWSSNHAEYMAKMPQEQYLTYLYFRLIETTGRIGHTLAETMATKGPGHIKSVGFAQTVKADIGLVYWYAARWSWHTDLNFVKMVGADDVDGRTTPLSPGRIARQVRALTMHSTRIVDAPQRAIPKIMMASEAIANQFGASRRDILEANVAHIEQATKEGVLL